MVEMRVIVRMARSDPNPTSGEVSRARAAAKAMWLEAFRLEMQAANQEGLKGEVVRVKKEVEKRLLFLTEKIRCGRELRNLMPNGSLE
jgi:hypothetical protein